MNVQRFLNENAVRVYLINNCNNVGEFIRLVKLYGDS